MVLWLVSLKFIWHAESLAEPVPYENETDGLQNQSHIAENIALRACDPHRCPAATATMLQHLELLALTDTQPNRALGPE